MNKKEKAVKALKLLFIGELIVAIGLLGELYLAYEPLAMIAIVSIIGTIIALIGITKLGRVNKFFLTACIIIGLSLLIGVTTGALTTFGLAPKVVEVMKDASNIIGKVFSFVFIFCVIRGCSKAATGSARSKIATIMTIVNIVGKGIAITFSILQSIFGSKNPTFAGACSIVSMAASMFVQIYFVYYIFIAYKKAKSLVNA